jgi:hypothetical protein
MARCGRNGTREPEDQDIQPDGNYTSRHQQSFPTHLIYELAARPLTVRYAEGKPDVFGTPALHH